jgi:molybdenum cofactor guanylyltransferase
MKSEFSGYVLAGGKSSRMGANKALLKFASGETFLERAVNNLKTVCRNRVKVVVNKKQFDQFSERFPGFEYIFDVLPARGALGGVHAALLDCATDFAVVLAVDLPLVNGETLENLARLALSKNVAAVVPTQADGRAQPLCAVYRVKKCLSPLEFFLSEQESASARFFLRRLDSVWFVPQNELSADERIFFNVNRPEDFAAVE